MLFSWKWFTDGIIRCNSYRNGNEWEPTLADVKGTVFPLYIYHTDLSHTHRRVEVNPTDYVWSLSHQNFQRQKVADLDSFERRRVVLAAAWMLMRHWGKNILPSWKMGDGSATVGCLWEMNKLCLISFTGLPLTALQSGPHAESGSALKTNWWVSFCACVKNSDLTEERERRARLWWTLCSKWCHCPCMHPLPAIYEGQINVKPQSTASPTNQPVILS